MGKIGVQGSRAYDLDLRRSLAETTFFTNNSQRQDAFDTRDRLLQSIDIRVGQTVLAHVTSLPASATGVIHWLDAPNDDVRAAEFLDGLLCLVARAFANRQHCDQRHRR